MVRTIPSDLIPDEPKLLGDWGTVEPEKWPCPTLYHACGICDDPDLYDDLDGALSHVEAEHPDRDSRPMAHVYAIPADDDGEPYATP